MKVTLSITVTLVFLHVCIAAPSQQEEHLLQASYNGNFEEIRELVEAGVNVNCESNYRNTPLYYASINNHTEIALFLLKHGAKPDTKGGSHADTPLINAVAFNNKTLVEQLIEVGANINLQNDSGRTALIVAVRKKNKKIIRIILDQPHVIVRRWDAYGNKALDYAREDSDLEIITMLEEAERKEVIRKQKAQGAPRKD
jgi:ankyrin repeat protein